MILTSLPVVISTFFVHPLLDDFSWPYMLKLTNSFWETQKFFFNKVNGRILATFATSIFLNPTTLYLTNKLGLLTWAAGYFYAIYLFLDELIDANTLQKIGITGITAFSLLMIYPRLSTQFFWLTGVFVYQSAFILCTLFLTLSLRIIRLNQTSENIGLRFCFTYALTAVAAVFFFEMSFLVIAAISVFTIYALYERKADYKIVLVVLLLAIGALIVNIKAPGNSIKAVQYSNAQQKHDILFACKVLYKEFFNVILSLKFIFISLPAIFILIYLVKEKIKVKAINNTSVLYYLLMAASLFSALHFAYVFMLGKTMPARVQNFVFSILILFVVLFVVQLSQINSISECLGKKGLKHLYYAAFVALLLTSLFPSPLRVVWGDLIHGRSYSYNREMKERYITVQHCADEICVVKKIPNPPQSIMFEDLPSDSTDNNSFFAAQFGYCYDKKWVFAK